MTASPGFALPLSLPRRLAADRAAASPAVPAVERRLCVAPLLAARTAAAPRPGWTALFTKAWALVCAHRAPLRQAFLRWPWPRLYQHPVTVASIAVERPYGAEDAVFFLLLDRPEARGVTDLDAQVKRLRHGEPTDHDAIRRQLRLARLPRPLRRLMWAGRLNIGRWRERFVGTFAVGSTGSLGADLMQPHSLLTTTLTFGPIAADGGVDVRVGYDPRVLDGVGVARALADLEGVLHGEVLIELRYLRDVRRGAA